MARYRGAWFLKTLHELRVECVSARHRCKEAGSGRQNEFLCCPALLAVLIGLISVKALLATGGARASLSDSAVIVLFVLRVLCLLRQGGAWNTHRVGCPGTALPKLADRTRDFDGAMCARNETTVHVRRVEVCFAVDHTRTLRTVVGHVLGTTVGDEVVGICARNAVVDAGILEPRTTSETVS